MNDNLPCCRKLSKLLKRICCCCRCCQKLCKCCNDNNGDDDMSQQEDIYMFQQYHHRLPADAKDGSSQSSAVASLRHVELNDSMGSTKSMIGKVYTIYSLKPR